MYFKKRDLNKVWGPDDGESPKYIKISYIIFHMKDFIFLSLTLFVMNLSAQDLKKHKWNNRILIVRTIHKDSDQFQSQLNQFKENQNGLMERKLILYSIVGENYEVVKFNNEGSDIKGKVSKQFKLQYFKNNEDFKVVLIGLDGSVKLEQQTILTIEKLYSKIDAMPMRRSELRKQ
jgi:hypothetical protein